MEYYLTIKRGCNSDTHNLDEPWKHYANYNNQTQKGKYCMIPLIHQE